MGDHLGQLVELEISNVAHGGVMVARHGGRVVFVADAIPGEVVRAVVTDDSKAKFWRADTVEVLEASPYRQPHVWSAASIDRAPEERAGGAEFGHIAPAHQRELKRRVLADALQRMAGLEPAVIVEALPGPADGTGWRTRVRLHAAEDGTLGPYVARSHRVVEVADLPLATPEVASAALLAGRKDAGRKQPGRAARAHGSRSVDVIGPSTGEPIVLRHGERSGPITERVGDREFRLDAAGFWQVHRYAAEVLTTAVQEAIDPELFDPAAANLDLYGGVGLLAAAVGDRFGRDIRIESVEGDSGATGHARENLADWAGASAVTARVDRYLSTPGTGAGGLAGATVVLDPPRSGAGKDVVAALGALTPAQLVYVACDPVALARDLALFAGHGYRLSGIRAFDLFPNTHHVEAVASLVRT
ncbi:TRAM domain-containing protein [Leifsonia bigeumensis]|uniref:TRAM domain-containing protein n=1 Tax=Leifsonella bigeumensis TaxID=433643 RepID=A0ABP7FAP0_9MICO